MTGLAGRSKNKTPGSQILEPIKTKNGERFGAGITGGMGGTGAPEDCQNFSGLGHETNIFNANFWRNNAGGNPQPATVITLDNLPQHTSIDLNILLALIDTIDSTDTFAIALDGVIIFQESFDNHLGYDGSYDAAPPPEVMLAEGINLGFSSALDSAWDLGADTACRR